MEEILSKKRYRRAFYFIVGLVLSLAGIIRYFVLPYFDEKLTLSKWAFVALTLDTLVSSVIITVVIASFAFWLRPEIIKRSVIDVVEPKEIGPLLRSATNTSRQWIYKGACGRYTRATTLPKMADAARLEGIGRDITIHVLNPSNLEVCREYAIYRQGLKSGTSNKWTQQRVQEEALSTVVVAMKYMYAEPLLRIRLYLLESFSTFRLDISDYYVVITKEDRQASALKADSGTYFYDSYKDEVRLIERQAVEVVLHNRLEIPSTLTEDDLQKALHHTNVLDPELLKSLNISYILKCINSPEDPYK